MIQGNNRGKIKQPPAAEVIKYVIEPSISAEEAERSFQNYVQCNKAHVLMLEKQGIIKTDVATKILEVAEEMTAMGDTPSFPLRPELEEMYFNMENYLISKVGIEVGGQQHTARSRNDLYATVCRMDVRKLYLEICRLYNEMRKTIETVARNNTDAVMAGYTHLQPSEPITFGQYCSAILNGMSRDYARIENAWNQLNLCPLGGGSMGSTTWNIDRNFTADLLGFNAPLGNSIDAVGSRDYILEILSAFGIAANTFTRLCQDLYVWATPDYGYVEVADEVAVCSSIMPQKKNPWTLEHVKGKSSNVEGCCVAAWMVMKNTPYTHNNESSGEGPTLLWTAFNEMKACIELLNVTFRGIKLNKKLMVQTATNNFCTMAELANTLVRADGISFRTAHDIVAHVVNHMLEHNKKASEIDVDVIAPIAKNLFGIDTKVTNEQIQLGLDPVKNVYSKNSLGGSAPEEVVRQLDELHLGILENERIVEQRCRQLNDAKARTEAKIQELFARAK